MKKVAYIGANQTGSFKRAEAFIKNGLGYEHTYVIFSENPETPAEWLNYPNTKIIQAPQFKYEDYDLVLHMNDKLFDMILEKSGKDLPNMADKDALAQKAREFGLDTFKVDNFSDEDNVIVKPRISSGSYSERSDCYSKQKFKDVKHLFGHPGFVIQEYHETSKVIMFSIVSSGEELFNCDVVEYEYLPDHHGKFFSAYMESQAHLIPHYKEQIDKLRAFIKFIGYDKIKSIFNVQFLVEGDKFYIMDFNTRTGPISCQLELHGLMDTRVYKLVPFMVGDKTLQECISNKPLERYRSYAELNGETLTKKVFYKNPSRVRVVEKKSSGAIRDDYEVYVEKFLDGPET